MDVPLYNTLAYFGSGYLISELCPACLTGISGCFFSLVFLFACFSFFCSLWLAFQVLPGPCNLHRPGGIPRIALGKGGKKKSTPVLRASRLTAPSPTLSRLLELEVLPPSLSLLRCLASLPTPRKPKPATWLHSPAARACASSYFPQRTCTLPARSIPYELYVLSVMACFTLVRTG